MLESMHNITNAVEAKTCLLVPEVKSVFTSIISCQLVPIMLQMLALHKCCKLPLNQPRLHAVVGIACRSYLMYLCHIAVAPMA